MAHYVHLQMWKRRCQTSFPAALGPAVRLKLIREHKNEILQKINIGFCCTSAEPLFRASVEGPDKQQHSGSDNVVRGRKFADGSGIT